MATRRTNVDINIANANACDNREQHGRFFANARDTSCSGQRARTAQALRQSRSIGFPGEKRCRASTVIFFMAHLLTCYSLPRQLE